MIRRPPRSTRMTHSFPTRRSSDLTRRQFAAGSAASAALLAGSAHFNIVRAQSKVLKIGSIHPRRSEEHTSELQSLMRISYAVFCLKKKNRKKTNRTPYNIAQHTSSHTTEKEQKKNTMTKE